MSQGFFNYPTQPDSDQPEDMVFLAHWDESRWAQLLKYAGTRSFHAGDIVINRGDRDRTLYIIIDGSLEVLTPRQGSKNMQRTWIRDAGSVIGEQAFIDGKPRSATVRALTDGEMLRLGIADFEVLRAHAPELAYDFLLDLARLLSVALRQANTLISNWVR